MQAPAELAETLDNDPKDRHVAATALSADADAIVTLNVADFESRVLDDAGLETLTPGVLVGRLLDEFPDVVERAVDHLAGRWVNPSMTAREITKLLAAHPTMAAPMAALRERIEGDGRPSGHHSSWLQPESRPPDMERRVPLVTSGYPPVRGGGVR